MDFLLFVLASIGFTWIIVDSSISASFKTWVANLSWLPQWFKDTFAQLTSCYQCSGFWAGISVAILMWLGQYFPFVKLLLYGFAASWLAPLGYLIISYLNVISSNFTESDYESSTAEDNAFEGTDQDTE